MPACYVTVNSPHTGAVRGKLEGPRGARNNNPAFPALYTTSQIIPQSPLDAWQTNRTYHGKVEGRRSKSRATTGSTKMLLGRRHKTWTNRHSALTYRPPLPFSPNITHNTAPQNLSPTNPRSPTLRPYNENNQPIEPRKHLTTTGRTIVVCGKQRGIRQAYHIAQHPDPPLCSSNITQRAARTPSPTDSRCPTPRSHSNKKTCEKPQTYTTGRGAYSGPERTPLHTCQPTSPHRGCLLATCFGGIR